MKLQGCRARQYSDTMICDSCGLQWDTNDPDPPECRHDNKPEPTGMGHVGCSTVEISYDDHSDK